MNMSLSRAQRRQIQKLADKVDRITQTDRRFFERFPDRQHRVRLAGQAEVEQFAIMDGVYETAPPAGFEHYVVVKNVAPGCRIRKPFTSRAGNETDVSETEAKWLYEWQVSDDGRKLETQMVRAMEVRS